jgi:hypothetical protein
MTLKQADRYLLFLALSVLAAVFGLVNISRAYPGIITILMSAIVFTYIGGIVIFLMRLFRCPNCDRGIARRQKRGPMLKECPNCKCGWNPGLKLKPVRLLWFSV